MCDIMRAFNESMQVHIGVWITGVQFSAVIWNLCAVVIMKDSWKCVKSSGKVFKIKWISVL